MNRSLAIYTLTHPDREGERRCDESQLPALEAQGYVVKSKQEPKRKPSTLKKAKKPAKGGGDA